MQLTDEVVAVIGAASGIGNAIARGAAERGARVVGFDVTPRPGCLPLDIRNGADVLSALEKVRADRGRLDGVVSTPSMNVRKRVLDYTDEEFDRVVELNLKGSFHVLQAAGRVMKEQGGGSIVVLSSIRSQVVEPGQAVYAATKAGIVQMVRTLAAELGEHGVRVNALAPGVVETPLTAPIRSDPEWHRAYAEKTVLKRWAKAEEMVGPALFLLSSAASYVTGSVLFADAGWTAVDGRFTPP